MRQDYETLRWVLEDHVCTVTLDRPERRNALNRTAYDELERIFREIQRAPEVRCVVLTGADPAFCSGEDVKEMMTGEPNPESLARLQAVRPAPTPAAAAILDCDRPVIAAVNGAAVGWGMDLALFADLRIASERARFGELFVKRGLVTDLGGLWRLPQIVGPQRAAQLLFTGDIIDAETAAAYGIVLETVAHEELLPRARALADRIAANPPLAVRYLKEGLRRHTWGDYEELGSWISQTLGVLFRTEDHREGVASFLEKRTPVFKGR
ncbi:MAG: enoyl-CoA hydratase-related protein [Pseudomonadales bacterium]|jgi:enoyl-CoA hydratase/carnithine racemase|nr:enoyl-CoA hydratase-related protein [Pseudomonadales bacterium]